MKSHCFILVSQLTAAVFSSGAFEVEYITMGIAISQCHLSLELIRHCTLIYWQNPRYPDEEASLLNWIKVVSPSFIAGAYGEPYCCTVSVITRRNERHSSNLLGQGRPLHPSDMNIYEVLFHAEHSYRHQRHRGDRGISGSLCITET